MLSILVKLIQTVAGYSVFKHCTRVGIQRLYLDNPKPSTIVHNRAHNKLLFIPAVATVKFLYSNGVLHLIIIVVSLKLS